jgi:hypothetical protein
MLQRDFVILYGLFGVRAVVVVAVVAVVAVAVFVLFSLSLSLSCCFTIDNQNSNNPMEKVGCSTPERPTAKWIVGHTSDYMVEIDMDVVTIIHTNIHARFYVFTWRCNS